MDLNEVIEKIKKDLDNNTNKVNIDSIYAFNGTGKTRISRWFVDENTSKCLCFNSIFQDCFVWNNENHVLNIDDYIGISKTIRDEGLDGRIIENFEYVYGKSVIPQFNDDFNQITFNVKTKNGYDSDVKISKAEETLFVWSVYYSFVETAVEQLSIDDVEDRSTHIFDDLKYVIIDDPVSSVDDSIIIKIAILIKKLIEQCNNLNIGFLITTHHILFFNSVNNLIRNIDSKIRKFKSYKFEIKNYEYDLSEDTKYLFGYHLYLKEKIQSEIDCIEKIHFNMFRVLLEKTANYCGYEKFGDCLYETDYKEEMVRLLNTYSHGNLFEFERTELTEHEKEIFVKSFNDYNEKYKSEEVE